MKYFGPGITRSSHACMMEQLVLLLLLLLMWTARTWEQTTQDKQCESTREHTHACYQDQLMLFRVVSPAAGKAALTVRASGTEPKLKYYCEVFSPLPDQAERQASAIEEGVRYELVRVQDSGLRMPCLEA